MPLPVLASDCFLEARALLNDQDSTLFTDEILLPFLKIANQKLELLLIVNGIPIQRQESAVVTYIANATEITVPSNFLMPINLWEGNFDATDGQFSPMIERQWDDNLIPVSTVTYWVFRDNKIKVPPCTTPRSIKIDYWRQLATVVDSDSSEEVASSKLYLSSKTAELAARYGGENPTRADSILQVEVAQAEDYLLRMYTKNQQGNRVRRRRFHSTRRFL